MLGRNIVALKKTMTFVDERLVPTTMGVYLDAVRQMIYTVPSNSIDAFCKVIQLKEIHVTFMLNLVKPEPKPN